MSNETIKIAFGCLSALGGLSGLASVIYLIKHRNKDKKETRINDFIFNYKILNKRDGGRILEPLIPSGINLLKNNDEIEEALSTLELIYPPHPIKQWDSEVKKIGYSKFFRYAVKKHNLRELTKDKMKILVDELKKQA